eukprot:gene2696-3470_t
MDESSIDAEVLRDLEALGDDDDNESVVSETDTLLSIHDTAHLLESDEEEEERAGTCSEALARFQTACASREAKLDAFQRDLEETTAAMQRVVESAPPSRTSSRPTSQPAGHGEEDLEEGIGTLPALAEGDLEGVQVDEAMRTIQAEREAMLLEYKAQEAERARQREAEAEMRRARDAAAAEASAAAQAAAEQKLEEERLEALARLQAMREEEQARVEEQMEMERAAEAEEVAFEERLKAARAAEMEAEPSYACRVRCVGAAVWWPRLNNSAFRPSIAALAHQFRTFEEEQAEMQRQRIELREAAAKQRAETRAQEGGGICMLAGEDLRSPACAYPRGRDGHTALVRGALGRRDAGMQRQRCGARDALAAALHAGTADEVQAALAAARGLGLQEEAATAAEAHAAEVGASGRRLREAAAGGGAEEFHAALKEARRLRTSDAEAAAARASREEAEVLCEEALRLGVEASEGEAALERVVTRDLQLVAELERLAAARQVDPEQLAAIVAEARQVGLLEAAATAKATYQRRRGELTLRLEEAAASKTAAEVAELGEESRLLGLGPGIVQEAQQTLGRRREQAVAAAQAAAAGGSRAEVEIQLAEVRRVGGDAGARGGGAEMAAQQIQKALEFREEALQAELRGAARNGSYREAQSAARKAQRLGGMEGDLADAEAEMSARVRRAATSLQQLVEQAMAAAARDDVTMADEAQWEAAAQEALQLGLAELAAAGRRAVRVEAGVRAAELAGVIAASVATRDEHGAVLESQVDTSAITHGEQGIGGSVLQVLREAGPEALWAWPVPVGLEDVAAAARGRRCSSEAGGSRFLEGAEEEEESVHPQLADVHPGNPSEASPLGTPLAPLLALLTYLARSGGHFLEQPRPFVHLKKILDVRSWSIRGDSEPYEDAGDTLPLTRKLLEANAGARDLKGAVRVDLGLEGLTSMRGLEQCPSLQVLLMNVNKVRRLEGLERCPQLEVLSMCDNQLSRVEGLERLSKLRALSLDVNRLTRVEALEGCPDLRHLSLCSNRITDLSGLAGLCNLRRLQLSSNAITSFGDALSYCSALQHLDVTVNQLSSLDGVGDCRQLQSLGASDNPLRALSGGGGLRLPLLRHLWLNRALLRSLPSLQGLPLLQSLHLQENRIAHLEPLRCCPLLRVLDLSFNRIERLEEVWALEGCSEMEVVQLNDNPVAAHPEYHAALQQLLPRLRELDNEAVVAVQQVAQGMRAMGAAPHVALPCLRRQLLSGRMLYSGEYFLPRSQHAVLMARLLARLHWEASWLGGALGSNGIQSTPEPQACSGMEAETSTEGVSALEAAAAGWSRSTAAHMGAVQRAEVSAAEAKLAAETGGVRGSRGSLEGLVGGGAAGSIGEAAAGDIPGPAGRGGEGAESSAHGAETELCGVLQRHLREHQSKDVGRYQAAFKMAARVASERRDGERMSAAGQLQAAWRGYRVRAGDDLAQRRADLAQRRAAAAAAAEDEWRRRLQAEAEAREALEAEMVPRIQAVWRGVRVRRRIRAAQEAARFLDDDDDWDQGDVAILLPPDSLNLDEPLPSTTMLPPATWATPPATGDPYAAPPAPRGATWDDNGHRLPGDQDPAAHGDGAGGGRCAEAAGRDFGEESRHSAESIGGSCRPDGYAPSSAGDSEASAASAMSEGRGAGGRGRVRGEKHRQRVQEVMHQWGFKDEASAELYLKSQARHNKPKRHHAREEKFRDPQRRLDRLKKEMEHQPAVATRVVPERPQLGLKSAQVFSENLQRAAVEMVEGLLERGRRGELQRTTLRSCTKGTPAVLQVGECVTSKEDVNEFPAVLKELVQHLLKREILPPAPVPNTAVVHIFEPGDSLPATQLESHIFRPAVVLSFLSSAEFCLGAVIETCGRDDSARTPEEMCGRDDDSARTPEEMCGRDDSARTPEEMCGRDDSALTLGSGHDDSDLTPEVDMTSRTDRGLAQSDHPRLEVEAHRMRVLSLSFEDACMQCIEAEFAYCCGHMQLLSCPANSHFHQEVSVLQQKWAAAQHRAMLAEEKLQCFARMAAQGAPAAAAAPVPSPAGPPQSAAEGDAEKGVTPEGASLSMEDTASHEAADSGVAEPARGSSPASVLELAGGDGGKEARPRRTRSKSNRKHRQGMGERPAVVDGAVKARLDVDEIRAGKTGQGKEGSNDAGNSGCHGGSSVEGRGAANVTEPSGSAWDVAATGAGGTLEQGAGGAVGGRGSGEERSRGKGRRAQGPRRGQTFGGMSCLEDAAHLGRINILGGLVLHTEAESKSSELTAPAPASQAPVAAAAAHFPDGGGQSGSGSTCSEPGEMQPMLAAMIAGTANPDPALNAYMAAERARALSEMRLVAKARVDAAYVAIEATIPTTDGALTPEEEHLTFSDLSFSSDRTVVNAVASCGAESRLKSFIKRGVHGLREENRLFDGFLELSKSLAERSEEQDEQLHKREEELTTRKAHLQDLRETWTRDLQRRNPVKPHKQGLLKKYLALSVEFNEKQFKHYEDMHSFKEMQRDFLAYEKDVTKSAGPESGKNVRKLQTDVYNEYMARREQYLSQNEALLVGLNKNAAELQTLEGKWDELIQDYLKTLYLVRSQVYSRDKRESKALQEYMTDVQRFIEFSRLQIRQTRTADDVIERIKGIKGKICGWLEKEEGGLTIEDLEDETPEVESIPEVPAAVEAALTELATVLHGLQQIREGRARESELVQSFGSKYATLITFDQICRRAYKSFVDFEASRVADELICQEERMEKERKAAAEAKKAKQKEKAAKRAAEEAAEQARLAQLAALEEERLERAKQEVEQRARVQREQEEKKARHQRERLEQVERREREAQQQEERELRQALAESRRAEEAKLAEQAARAEEAQRVEAAKLAEEAERAEAAELAEEAQRVEAAKLAEEAQRVEAAELAEQAARAEEAQRVEAAKLAEEAQRVEAAKLAEEAQRAEAAKLAEEAQRAEAAKLAEEAQRAEAAKLAEEAERAERAEEAERAEAAKLAEARQPAGKAEVEGTSSGKLRGQKRGKSTYQAPAP